MGTADNAFGGAYGAREFGPNEWANARWRRNGGRWTAFEIIAMVLGFIVFWPIGLAILGYKFWQSRNGGPDLQTLAANKWQDVRAMMGSNSSWGCGAMKRASRFTSASGNAAFDEWRTAELARLDEERRKLDEAQREFAEYVDAIRRAKDREEFDRFMAERRARPAGGGQPG
jgi:predicted negative regulator of RcsB-dependent stress response